MNRVPSVCHDVSATAACDKLAPPRPWQFSLRGAFVLLTASSGAAALVAYRGAGSLALSIGLLWAWLNVRGAFRSVQTPRARPKVFYAAWLLLGVSLFLPAAKGCNNSYIYGWQTAYLCAAAEIETAQNLAQNRESGPEQRVELATGFAWLTMINLANLLLVLSPLLLWRLQRGQGGALSAALGVNAVAAWAVPMREPHLLIGCYVWCASFAVVLMACPLGRRTLLAMIAVAAVFVLAAFS